MSCKKWTTNKIMQTFKAIVLGDSGSGKTSLVTRYITGKFDQSLCGGTIGVDYHSVTDTCKTYQVQIWDTAGQERFRSLTKIHYRGTDCALIIFDLHDPDTDNKVLEAWIDELIKYGSSPDKSLHIAIIGNKADLSVMHKVSINLLKTKYPQISGYYETSAKTGHNVQQSFSEILSNLQETLIDVPLLSLDNAMVTLSKPLISRNYCC